MSTFSDFDFYRDEYHGKLTEDQYNASKHEAKATILSETLSRAANAPEMMKEAVKLCECALVDILHSHKKSREILPSGITSVSNDGYSVTAGSTNRPNTEAAELRAMCAKFLQTPVNLMCRWI